MRMMDANEGHYHTEKTHMIILFLHHGERPDRVMDEEHEEI